MLLGYFVLYFFSIRIYTSHCCLSAIFWKYCKEIPLYSRIYTSHCYPSAIFWKYHFTGYFKYQNPHSHYAHSAIVYGNTTSHRALFFISIKIHTLHCWSLSRLFYLKYHFIFCQYYNPHLTLLVTRPFYLKYHFIGYFYLRIHTSHFYHSAIFYVNTTSQVTWLENL